MSHVKKNRNTIQLQKCAKNEMECSKPNHMHNYSSVITFMYSVDQHIVDVGCQ